jgi:acyl-CoA synthetase (AMP-forming)/AMP-acid ligase II
VPDTLTGWLAWAAEQGRPGTGLRFVDRVADAPLVDWATITDRALRAAGALRAHGVRPGDRVAIVLPTAPSFFDAWLGAQLAGAVPVPLYPPVRLGRLDEYLERTAAMLRAVDAALLVSDARVQRVLGRVLDRARPRLGLLDAAALPSGEPYEVPATADDLALVQFSSGTTVDPKPVALTHAQLLANARRILDVVLDVAPKGGDPEPAGCSWLPLYHDMGLIGGVLPAILCPGPLTLIPPEQFLARPAIWLECISRYRATVSPAPDFAYALCVERITDAEREGLDLSSWRMALDGAEPISAANLRAFAARFGPVGFDPSALMPVYGLSEAALAVTFTPARRGVRTVVLDRDALREGRAAPAQAGAELVTLGPPLPDFGVRIVGADGAALGEGLVGRVHVRGPSLMRGYLDRDVQPFVDGWLDTGDLGFLVDGELVVTGRAKDVIVHRGRNHAPQELERAVDAVEGVRTGCTVAVGDVSGDGERVLVFVEVREAVEGQAEACARAVRAATGIEPDLVLLCEAGTLPRTSSGKLRRGEALRRFREGTLSPPRKVTPWMLAGAMADSLVGHLKARWGLP